MSAISEELFYTLTADEILAAASSLSTPMTLNFELLSLVPGEFGDYSRGQTWLFEISVNPVGANRISILPDVYALDQSWIFGEETYFLSDEATYFPTLYYVTEGYTTEFGQEIPGSWSIVSDAIEALTDEVLYARYGALSTFFQIDTDLSGYMGPSPISGGEGHLILAVTGGTSESAYIEESGRVLVTTGQPNGQRGANWGHGWLQVVDTSEGAGGGGGDSDSADGLDLLDDILDEYNLSPLQVELALADDMATLSLGDLADQSQAAEAAASDLAGEINGAVGFANQGVALLAATPVRLDPDGLDPLRVYVDWDGVTYGAGTRPLLSSPLLEKALKGLGAITSLVQATNDIAAGLSEGKSRAEVFSSASGKFVLSALSGEAGLVAGVALAGTVGATGLLGATVAVGYGMAMSYWLQAAYEPLVDLTVGWMFRDEEEQAQLRSVQTMLAAVAETDAAPWSYDPETGEGNFLDETNPALFSYVYEAVVHGRTSLEYHIQDDTGTAISGTIGDDLVAIGASVADVYLGSGHDLLLFESGAHAGTVYGQAGEDTLIGSEGGESLRGGAGNDVIRGLGGRDLLDGGLGSDRISGGAGADTIGGGQGHDRLDGNAGADRLAGEAGWDTLDGGEGDDTLSGDAGADLLDGGAGRDSLDGGAGPDKLNGGSGADTLIGGAGDDTLNGGADGDLLWGGTGEDVLNGKAGADTLAGGDGNDLFNGGRGRDSLSGGSGADTLNGEKGADRLDGGLGADVLKGGSGDDWLRGGAGPDILHGGLGSDTFVFSVGHDVILDFDAADSGERIDMRSAKGVGFWHDLLNNHVEQSGHHVLISDDAGNTLTLRNVGIADLDRSDFLL